MGYADTVMLLRDADSSTEILLERDNGESDDGYVLELRVTLNYEGSGASQHCGYVRLRAEYLHKLAEWLGEHSNTLRTIEWAEKHAPNTDGPDSEDSRC